MPRELVDTGQTVFKVHTALKKAGISDQVALDAITEMQNAGIYFREVKTENRSTERLVVKKIKLYGAGAIALFVSLILLPFALGTSAMADTSSQSHDIKIASTGTTSVGISWRGVGPVVQNEVLIYDASTLALVKHTSFEAGDNDGRTVNFETGYEGRALDLRVDFKVNGVTTGWSLPVTFYTAVTSGIVGPKGDTGNPGPVGPSGPSGVVASSVEVLNSTSTIIHTGGSFLSQEQLAGSFDLTAGTYLVTLSAKVAWASGNGVFPQLFAYDGSPVSDFSNDISNIGNGALAQGNAAIDSYYNGTFQLTVASSQTVKVYAFGYDTDTGAGTYTLENLTATVTQLQVSS